VISVIDFLGYPMPILKTQGNETNKRVLVMAMTKYPAELKTREAAHNHSNY